jgi:hypothetical protein
VDLTTYEVTTPYGPTPDMGRIAGTIDGYVLPEAAPLPFLLRSALPKHAWLRCMLWLQGWQ